MREIIERIEYIEMNNNRLRDMLELEIEEY